MTGLVPSLSVLGGIIDLVPLAQTVKFVRYYNHFFKCQVAPDLGISLAMCLLTTDSSFGLKASGLALTRNSERGYCTAEARSTRSWKNSNFEILLCELSVSVVK